MKPNYFIIPLFTIFIAILGSDITSKGMEWYDKLNLPSFTPPGSVIGAVWTVLFILATISTLIFYNREQCCGVRFFLVVLLFVVNGVLNILWSQIFFGTHLLHTAIWEAGALGLSVLALIIFVWPTSRLASILLVPYFLWVSFAPYLTYAVWLLNK